MNRSHQSLAGCNLVTSLLDVSSCRNGNYLVLLDPTSSTASPPYRAGYQVDTAGKDLLVRIGRAAGVCGTCTAGGSQVRGFRAEVRGTITELGSAINGAHKMTVSSARASFNLTSICPPVVAPTPVATPIARPAPVAAPITPRLSPMPKAPPIAPQLTPMPVVAPTPTEATPPTWPRLTPMPLVAPTSSGEPIFAPVLPPMPVAAPTSPMPVVAPTSSQSVPIPVSTPTSSETTAMPVTAPTSPIVWNQWRFFARLRNVLSRLRNLFSNRKESTN
jgi:hypothetical protein